jgi:hypothetical protein
MHMAAGSVDVALITQHREYVEARLDVDTQIAERRAVGP